jgi:hypothetical protein
MEVGRGSKSGTLPLNSLTKNILVYTERCYHPEFLLSSEVKEVLHQLAFFLFILFYLITL